MKDALKNPEHPAHKNYTGNVSYDEFIELYLTKGKRPSFAHLSSQFNFMKLQDGSIGVDRIFPMNRLDLITSYLSDKLGVEINIPMQNVSPKKAIQLDCRLESLLREHLKNDIKLYELVKHNEGYNKKLHLNEFSTLI